MVVALLGGGGATDLGSKKVMAQKVNK